MSKPKKHIEDNPRCRVELGEREGERERGRERERETERERLRERE